MWVAMIHDTCKWVMIHVNLSFGNYIYIYWKYIYIEIFLVILQGRAMYLNDHSTVSTLHCNRIKLIKLKKEH